MLSKLAILFLICISFYNSLHNFIFFLTIIGMNQKKIFGQVRANPSKSYMQRALILAALSDSPSRIFNPSFDLDSLAAMNLIEKLNCKIEKYPNYIEIVLCELKFQGAESFNCGESGLLMRMIAPVLALFDNEFTLIAEESLMKRELFEIEEVLKSLGVKVETNNNYPPIVIHGPINPGHIKLNADKTSQFLTGLLIALPLLKEKCTIEVVNLASKPYIDITLDLVSKFGGKINWVSETLIEILPSKYSGQDIYIEGDWSSAAVFLIAGAIAGELTITGLNLNSKQGDKEILDVLDQVGAKLDCHSERSEESGVFDVTVTKQELKAFEFDAKDTPDLVPYLAILAANCKGISTIHNVSRLNFKESKRLDLIINNFSILGIKTELNNDILSIWSGEILGGNFETGNDHRLAMAGALASLTSVNEMIIDNPGCVKKSFPDFWNDINSLIKI